MKRINNCNSSNTRFRRTKTKETFKTILFFMFFAALGFASGWFIGRILSNYISDTILGFDWLCKTVDIIFMISGTLLGIIAFIQIRRSVLFSEDVFWYILWIILVPIILAALAALIALVFFLINWFSVFFASPEWEILRNVLVLVGLGLGAWVAVGLIVFLFSTPEIIIVFFRQNK